MKLFKSNFHHNNRVNKISFKLNIEEEIVEEALDIMYDYIRSKLEEVDIDKDKVMDEKSFDKEFPVICIPSLGYLKPSYKKYKHIMKNKSKKSYGNSKKESK